jgi:hypothetical protein
VSDLETDPIVAAYDFSGFDTIVDVGGGRGALLAAILRRATRSTGVLFDGNAGHLAAPEVLAEAGVAQRCTIVDGGLFDPPPAGADAYILKHIVHDWPEPDVLKVLKNVRNAIGADGRLLLMEFVAPEGNTPHPAKLVDLWLMLLVGGMERTAAQYSALLGAAGFRIERVVQTATPLSIVEARPVDVRE